MATFLLDRRSSIKLTKPGSQNWAIAFLGRSGWCLGVNPHFPSRWTSVGVCLDGPAATKDFEV